jgi:hypothetical protein
MLSARTFLIAAVSAIVLWIVIVCFWVQSDCGVRKDWNPGLFGDSLAILTVLLTAAAGYGVFRTFEKEREQLDLARTQHDAARLDSRLQSINSIFAVTIAAFISGREQYTRKPAGARGQMAELISNYVNDAIVSDNLLLLDAWCRLALDEIGDDDLIVQKYSRLVYGFLIDAEKRVARDVLSGTQTGRVDSLRELIPELGLSSQSTQPSM